MMAALRVAALLLPALLGAGCHNFGQIADYERKIGELERDLSACRAERESQKSALEESNRRLALSRALPFDAKKTFHPVRIVIDPLSMGTNYDNLPGDDGVNVYLKPIDADGDTVKAAGEIRIQLFDLAAPASEQALADHQFSIDEVRLLWYGKFMTSHFTLKCPWQSGPPKNSEITIRATFVDYISQNILTAQAVCRVKLAP